MDNTTEQRPLVYTRDEIAEIMHVHVETVSRWISEGKLKRVPGTHRVLINREDFDDFRRSQ